MQQRAALNEMAELLETAKCSLVNCATREAELRNELSKARAQADTLAWQIEDVTINNDAEKGEKEEATKRVTELEDEISNLQVRHDGEGNVSDPLVFLFCFFF